MGRLQRHFGLTIDNLRAVELVTADGRTVRASESEEPDLFWGIRGAGANFGVVTAFEFDLHEFGPLLHRGVRIYRAAQVHEVWSMVRDFATVAPDELALIVAIGRAEPEEDYPESVAGEPVVIVAYNHSGDAAAVERDVAPLRSGPEPVSSTDGSQPYLEVQTAHDLAMGWGHRSYIMGGYANDLRPAALDALVEHAARAPGGSSFSITVQGGAIGRVPDDAMAFTGRDARFDVSADTEWDDPALDETYRDWVRRAMAIVEPDTVTGRYVNEIAESGPEESRTIYGDAKLARLAALKRAWDPDNVFHLNHNIAPVGRRSGLAQRVDRRGRDDPLDAARQVRVQGDERVRLQLGECDVLGVVGRGPSQPIRQVPGPAPEHGVAEEPDRHPPDAGEAVARDVGRDLAPLDGLVQGRQRLGPQERRCEELVLARDVDPRAREVEDGAGVDDEPGHRVPPARV